MQYVGFIQAFTAIFSRIRLSQAVPFLQFKTHKNYFGCSFRTEIENTFLPDQPLVSS